MERHDIYNFFYFSVDTGFSQDFPVEDGCLLALPYSVGANGYALRADGTALDPENGMFELY